MELKLGRLPHFDERSKNFPIRSIAPQQEPVTREWETGSTLNQGTLSACVGFSWTHYLTSFPQQSIGFNEHHAIGIYRTAQTLDEYPGENYEGTSCLAGVKALKILYSTVIDSYHWAFSLNEVLSALSFISPVVLGIDWFTEMFDPVMGFIIPRGRKVGGHAILATGVNMELKYVTLKNSWGNTWGDGGKCKITFTDLEKLLKRKGEACIAMGKHTMII